MEKDMLTRYREAMEYAKAEAQKGMFQSGKIDFVNKLIIQFGLDIEPVKKGK